MRIGAQLYTVRDACQNLTDFAETLKRVADMGYTAVQVSGSCDFDPHWLKGELDKNGLVCPLTHTAADRIIGDTEAVCRDHDVFGCRNIGLGYYGFRGEDFAERYEVFKEKFTVPAKKMREMGHYFMFHNHDGEFQHLEGKTLLRKMAEEFDSRELGFILDIFWIQAGGANPAEYIRELKGRVPCIHLKDYTFGHKYAVIGEGNINMDAVAAAAEEAGTEYLLVEQDECYGEDPFVCLKRSYENLRAMGLE